MMNIIMASLAKRGKAITIYILITIVITLCLQLGCSGKSSKPGASEDVHRSEPSVVLEKAQTLFAERENVEKLREAVGLLSNARDPRERSFEIEWKFAKYSYFLGKQTDDREQASAIFEKGSDAASIASRLEPEKPDGYFWYGANLGELSKLSPVTVGLKSRDEIRESMEKVIRIEPGYQGASAFDILGQLEMKTRLFGGDAEKAVEFLEKGLELNKENSYLRLHLAEAYLAVKRDDDARRQIDQILRMKPHPEFVLEHSAAVNKARRLLETQF